MSTMSPAPSQVRTMTMPGPNERRYSPTERGTGGGGVLMRSPDPIVQGLSAGESREIVEEVPHLVTALVGLSAGQVRGDVAARRTPQRMIGRRRLGLGDIQPRRAEMAAVQRGDERILID